MEKELVSIVVPVYNVKQYLRRCVESIVNQSYHTLEILLIDDGSTDGSSGLCDEMKKMDDRIRVFHQMNQGLSAARNKGLDEMKGEWVLFVDSDDYIAHDCVQMLYNMAKQENASIASGALFRTQEENLDFAAVRNDKKVETINGRQAMRAIYGVGPKWLGIEACAKLFSASLFHNHRFRRGILHEDEELIWKILYPCSRIATTQQVVYAYYTVPGSIMHSKFSAKRLASLDILAERASFFEKDGDKELWELTLKTRCYVLFDFYQQCQKELPSQPELWKQLKREFHELFPRVIRMSAVNWKSKCVLFQMRFFPRAYAFLKSKK